MKQTRDCYNYKHFRAAIAETPSHVLDQCIINMVTLVDAQEHEVKQENIAAARAFTSRTLDHLNEANIAAQKPEYRAQLRALIEGGE